MKNIFLFLVTLPLLVGCKDEVSSNIYKAPIGDTFICLDKAYHSWGDDPNDSGIFITAMRPNMQPISRSERKNRSDDYKINKISISVALAMGGLPQKTVEYRLEQYLPTDQKKYDLSVTQDISKSQSHALYIEPEFEISDPKAGYFRCSTYGSPNPQCSHNFEHGHFSYGIDYSQKNLEDWKAIKNQLIKFVESSVCK